MGMVVTTRDVSDCMAVSVKFAVDLLHFFTKKGNILIGMAALLLVPGRCLHEDFSVAV